MGETTITDLNAIAIPARAAIGKRGVNAAPSLPLTYVRDLGEEDLPALLGGLRAGSGETGEYTLNEIKSRHHMLAMALASGTTVEEAAFITRYSPGTIRQLQTSPAFKELLSYYGSQKEAEFKTFYSKAASVGLDILEVLHQRVQDDPDALQTKDLTNLMEKLLDRTVLPSKAKAAGEGGAPPPTPITQIVFVESPHAGLPQVEDPRLIEGTAR